MAEAKPKKGKSHKEERKEYTYNKLKGLGQEIIEEMTANELLCPIQEFEAPESERPEAEMDYDGLMDMLDARGG